MENESLIENESPEKQKKSLLFPIIAIALSAGAPLLVIIFAAIEFLFVAVLLVPILVVLAVGFLLGIASLCSKTKRGGLVGVLLSSLAVVIPVAVAVSLVIYFFTGILPHLGF
jgi:hypothetical protein